MGIADKYDGVKCKSKFEELIEKSDGSEEDLDKGEVAAIKGSPCDYQLPKKMGISEAMADRARSLCELDNVVKLGDASSGDRRLLVAYSVKWVAAPAFRLRATTRSNKFSEDWYGRSFFGLTYVTSLARPPKVTGVQVRDKVVFVTWEGGQQSAGEGVVLEMIVRSATGDPDTNSVLRCMKPSNSHESQTVRIEASSLPQAGGRLDFAVGGLPRLESSPVTDSAACDPGRIFPLVEDWSLYSHTLPKSSVSGAGSNTGISIDSATATLDAKQLVVRLVVRGSIAGAPIVRINGADAKILDFAAASTSTGALVVAAAPITSSEEHSKIRTAHVDVLAVDKNDSKNTLRAAVEIVAHW